MMTCEDIVRKYSFKQISIVVFATFGFLAVLLLSSIMGTVDPPSNDPYMKDLSPSPPPSPSPSPSPPPLPPSPLPPSPSPPIPLDIPLKSGSMSGGAYYTCALDLEGKTQCWGDPIHVGSVESETFTKVSSGGFHACGIRGDGTAKCWGRDSAGQSTPEEFKYSDIGCGGYHCCGIVADLPESTTEQDGKIITKGLVKCWGGDRSTNQAPTDLADANKLNVKCPRNGANSDLDKSIVCKFYDGDMASCNGLLVNNNPICTYDDAANTCSAIAAGTEKKSKVCTGILDSFSNPATMCSAFRYDGDASCGYSSTGQAFYNTEDTSDVFTSIYGGMFHACAMRADGDHLCWGRSSEQQQKFQVWQVGASRNTGGTVDKGELIKYSQLDLGGLFTCGIFDENGADVKASTDLRRSPDYDGTEEVPNMFRDTLENVTKGMPHCWGDGDQGLAPLDQDPAKDAQGYGAIFPPLVDASAEYPLLKTYTKVATGAHHACALDANGLVDCWGDNTDGQATVPQKMDTLGNIDTTAPYKFIDIVCGWYHSCGMLEDNKVICWGNNDFNQLMTPKA